tara:strand:- start:12169 stop:13329 length:1161 start_codon:yes stop_codon:yes gene_type:complete
MASVLYFSRDTKFYVEIGSAVWEVPILDGFSFSQTTNSTEVVLAEMEDSAGSSRRGRRLFNDSLAPVEWSFSTYVRPFKSAGTNTAGNAEKNSTTVHHAVEEVLWALMVGDATYTSPTTSQASDFTGFTADTTDLDIDFNSSNKSTLGTSNMYFSLDDGGASPTVYKLTGAVVNEATLDFDIDGIATIQWSGFAATVTQDSKPTRTVFEDITATDNFIRNRLTTLAIDANDTTTFPGKGGGNAGEYELTLTAGNITISNNITFITPEELGIVNVPLGHVTGARSISGSFSCYLNFDNASNNGTSTDFFQDLTSTAARAKIVNKFETIFKIGGASGTPRLELNMPTAHFEIPSHSIEDVISLETNFHALPSTISGTNELTLKYVGAA